MADAVVVNVGGDADDFAPVVGGGDANAFADGVGGRIPIFASEIFRNDGDGKRFVDVRPREIAPGNQGSAFGFEKSQE